MVTCPLCFTPIPQASHVTGPLAGLAYEMPTPQLTGQPAQQAASAAPEPFPQPALQAPEPAAPTPLAPPPMTGPGVRVSLTGEVMDSGAPAGPPPSYVGGAIPITPPRGGQAGAAPRATADRRTPERAPARSGGGNVVGIVAGVAVLLAVGFGGWYWWMHRTNPKDQALAVYKAFLSNNYKTAYALSALSADTMKKYPDAESYSAAQQKAADAALESSPFLKPLKGAIDDALKGAAASATVGEPAITGDKAEVPTSASLTIMGQSVALKGTAHMVNDGGIWKLDATTETPSRVGKTRLDLIGRPNLGGGR